MLGPGPGLCYEPLHFYESPNEGPKSVKTNSEFANSKIYLDYNATTPLHPEISQKIPEALAAWGNPSSIHWAGRLAKTLIREARIALAQALGVSPLEIIFTSGGSEGNNTVLQSFFERTRNQERCELITTTVEHPSVLKMLEHFETLGAVVHRIPVDRQGQFDWQMLDAKLSEKTALVFVMMANNETGLLLPVKEIVERAHAVGAKVHTDAVQVYGKIPLNLEELGVDFASIAAHKFYAFKGAGALYIKKGNDLRSLIFGGGQERQRRGGTENTLGIWAMGLMAGKQNEISDQAARIEGLRNKMEKQILAEIPGVQITHAKQERLPGTSNVVITGVDGDTLLMSLDVKGFAVSTGSACSSGNSQPSAGLQALGLSLSEAQSSLRISLGWPTTETEILSFVSALKLIVPRLRGLSDQDARPEKIERDL